MYVRACVRVRVCVYLCVFAGDMCGMAPVENLKSFAKKIIAPLVRLTTGSQQVHRLTLLYSLYHVVGAFGDMIGTFAPQIQVCGRKRGRRKGGG